ncbi:MAG TPA: hypothetical protein VHR45_05200 [Thermoanaerobaculia bacterium]|nr:hypothetical protein [Thermoanaerobaculia bacterium]
MSYLDVPRLHFAGTFTADPSTINNTIANYDPANRGQLNLSWNPYGSHAWTVTATVRSFVDGSGTLHLAGDPVIGAGCQSHAAKYPAKLVDLDTDQQGRTRLYGFDLRLVAGGATLLQGHFLEAGTLLNLWFTRVPSMSGDTAAGGAFQSVLQALQWDAGSSPLLGQLQAASPDGLSIRLSCYGYNDRQQSAGFQHGKIVGTIGPWQRGQPRFNAVDRFLGPPPPPAGWTGGSPLWFAPAKVDPRRSTLTFDLGNSVPEQTPGGPPIDLGTMQAAVLLPGGPAALGAIDYQLEVTAGVAQVELTPQQLQQVAGQPLAVLIAGGVGLAESSNGLYTEADGATLYMNPGDRGSMTLVATTFGQPAPGLALPLTLIPQPGPDGQDQNNQPAGALSFPQSVTTGADGRAEIPLQASNPAPKPARRKFVDGQLYFIGGPWASAADNVPGAPITVKVFNSIDPPIVNPTWKDVAPILFEYYFLYAYMASIVDLSSYDDVKANAKPIAAVLALPESDPNFMPVTREMSADQRRLVLQWLQAGCPA